jgi:hypothetical protein
LIRFRIGRRSELFNILKELFIDNMGGVITVGHQ